MFQEVPVTPVNEMHVNTSVCKGNIVPIKLPPEELTVIFPVELLINVHDIPRCKVDVTGITTVCVVTPVKYCWLALATVNVVVPAEVAVVEDAVMALFAFKLLLASQTAIPDADGVAETKNRSFAPECIPTTESPAVVPVVEGNELHFISAMFYSVII